MAKDAKPGPKLPVKQLAILAVVRFAEPLAYTSVTPYLPEMIRDFGVNEDDVGKWAGLTSAAFSLAQSITAVPWGRAADRYGRKPALVVGLLSTMTCFIIWGMSTSLTMAIIVRAIQGGGNGNVGIIRTMVAEMVPQKELQPRAFSIMPLVWSLGSVVGPAFGGFFAKPAEQYPDTFGRFEFFKKFPYALPNLLATFFFLISACSAIFFLKETLATKKDGSDWGLLVGQRLTRAFRRKPKNADRRRTSFVDGEATAPLVPSRAIPRNGKTQGPVTMKEVFTYQTVVALMAYSFLAFHSVAYDQNIAVFLSFPVIPRTPENYQPPLYFTGGFGLDPGRIGTIFTIYGVSSAAIQFLLYPILVDRFGVLRTFHFCCKFLPSHSVPSGTATDHLIAIGLPIIYFLTPFASLFPSAQGRFIAITIVMILKAFGIIIAFPSTTILLTNSCTSLRILSTLNGFATMFSALCRAMGPASTGLVFTWGAKKGYICSAYFYLGIVAMLGAVPGFMIIEGDGPTAGQNAPVDSGDSDDGTLRDSGVLLPNESAVGSSDDEDEDGESQPLLGGKQRNGSGTKYNSITGR